MNDFSERELTPVCNVRALYSAAVEIFGNVSTPLPRPSIDIHGKLYGDRPRKTHPSIGGVKRKMGSQIERFWTHRRLYLGNGAR